MAIVPLPAHAHAITIRNQSADKVGFYYYTRSFESIEFYIQSGKTFTILLDEPCWITQLSVYQTPYYLNINEDSLLLSTDEKGIAGLAPLHDKDTVLSNELNAFRFVSQHAARTENQILFEILSKRNYQEIDKIITRRYKSGKKSLDDYLLTHRVSGQFASLAYSELLLNRHSYQYLWIGNAKIKFDVPASYKKYLDSISTAMLSDTVSNSLGLPCYQTDYFSFFYHCKQEFTGTTSPELIYVAALKEIRDRRILDKILFFIVKNEITEKPRSDKGFIRRFFYDCRDQGFIHSIREQLSDDSIRRTMVSHDGMMTPDKTKLNFNDMLTANAGKLIFIDLWASWCAPCRAEMPAAEKIRERYRGKAIAFIYISVDNDLAAWKIASEQDKISTLKDNYALANFERSDIKKKYNIATIPRFLLFDKKGNLLRADAPRPDDAGLTDLLDKLLAE